MRSCVIKESPIAYKERILRWMSGLTLTDRVRNERIRDNLKIDPIDENLRDSVFRWFSYISRKPNTTPVRRVERLRIKGSRRIG